MAAKKEGYDLGGGYDQGSYDSGGVLSGRYGQSPGHTMHAARRKSN